MPAPASSGPPAATSPSPSASQLPVDSLLQAADLMLGAHSPALPRARPGRVDSQRSDASLPGGSLLQGSKLGNLRSTGWLATNDAMPPLSLLLEGVPGEALSGL